MKDRKLSDIENKILAHLQQVVNESGQTEQVTSNTELLGLGLLDSIGLVGLIGFIEENFGIQLSDDEIAPELFESPGSIAAFVQSKV